MHDIVIVGAGPAGCAAAVQCVRLGVTPHLVDQTGRCGGLIRDAFLVENYPGMESIQGQAIAALLEAHVSRFDIPVSGAVVSGVSSIDGSFSVLIDEGSMKARIVILAVGTKPRKLTLPNLDRMEEHVYYSVNAFLSHVSEPSHAVIIGGGECALDYALTLHSRGVSATLLVRSNALRARGRLAEAVARISDIRICFEHAIRDISPKGPGIEISAVHRDGMSILRADGLLVAIGRQSAAHELLRDFDSFSPTLHARQSMEGLFIVGDARLGSLGQMGIAVGDGIAAATEAVTLLSRRES